MINYLLDAISNYVIVANFIALIIALYLRFDDQSVVISIITLCALNGAMQWISYYLESKYGVWNKDLMRHVYYLTFAMLEALGIYLLVLVHGYFGVKPTKVAKTIGLSFVAISILIMTKYYVRMHFSDNPDLTVTRLEILVQFVYSHGVPAISLGTSIMLMYILARTRKRELKGVQSV